MKNRSVLEIDLNLLKKNCKTLKSLAGDSFFCPMVKADAYGHGIVPVTKALLSLGVQQVGVINLNEAWPIKDLLKDLDILIFGPVLSQEDLSCLVEEEFVLVCSNWLDLKNLSQIKKSSRIHLKFDTGFSRLGFALNEVKELCDFLKDNSHIKLEGLATQLVLAEELGDKKSFSSQQMELFFELKKSFSCPHFHLLNTSALLASFVHNIKTSFGVRPGIGLYGIKPKVLFQNETAKKRWEDLSFSSVSSLKSDIVALHQLQKGDSVSYGGTWKASRPSQIATVALGYGDGFLRSFGSVREVLFRGQRRPVVGTVCMDFFMIDVTDLDKKDKAICLGEEVVIFGKQKEAFLSPENQAESSGSISYELFSRLGARVERIYKN